MDSLTIPEILRMILEGLDVWNREPLRLVSRDWDVLIRDIHLNRWSIPQSQVHERTLHLELRGVRSPVYLAYARSQEEFDRILDDLVNNSTPGPKVRVHRAHYRNIARWTNSGNIGMVTEEIGIYAVDWPLWELSQRTPELMRQVRDDWNSLRDYSDLYWTDYCIPSIEAARYLDGLMLVPMLYSMGAMTQDGIVKLCKLLKHPHHACLAIYSWLYLPYTYQQPRSSWRDPSLRELVRLIDGGPPKTPADADRLLDEAQSLVDRNWDLWIGSWLRNIPLMD